MFVRIRYIRDEASPLYTNVVIAFSCRLCALRCGLRPCARGAALLYGYPDRCREPVDYRLRDPVRPAERPCHRLRDLILSEPP